MDRKLWGLALGLVLAGCNAPAPPPAQGTDAQAGLVVVETDYSSTNVALLGQDGGVLSPSVASSGSGTVGLSAPLSGDVVLPGPGVRGRVAVIDQGNNVISWVDPATTHVVQLSVAAGSSSNPQDYVAVSPHRAYVPELEGKDLLVIDPSVPRITGHIDLMPAMKGAGPDYLPRANRVVLAGGRLYVLLSGYTSDFCHSAESRLARIDPATASVDDVLVLKGLHDCTAAALSPDGSELAVDCWGFDQCTGDPVISESGVALVSLGSSLALDRTFAAADLGEGAIALGVAWSGSHTLLVTSFGQEADSSRPSRQDKLIELDTATGQHRVLLSSDPFALGDVRCVADKACFAADAGRGVVDRFSVGEDGRLGEATAVHVGANVGLPPRYLGWFEASGG